MEATVEGVATEAGATAIGNRVTIPKKKVHVVPSQPMFVGLVPNMATGTRSACPRRGSRPKPM
jgi:hypothetical protein